MDEARYLQGCTKRWNPGSVNMKRKNYVLLPAAGRRAQLFTLIILEPGPHGLTDPCRLISCTSFILRSLEVSFIFTFVPPSSVVLWVLISFSDPLCPTCTLTSEQEGRKIRRKDCRVFHILAQDVLITKNDKQK